VELVEEAGNFFAENDPSSELGEKFQRTVNSVLFRYKEMYKKKIQQKKRNR
jgi:hypothetical protein